MGSERRSMVISDREKRTTAWHEAGHTLVAQRLPHHDPIHKVTIIPRGRAMGVTHFLPMDERHTYSREYCSAILDRMMGGRAAEEVIFDQITTGAGNDILQATNLARKMVTEWGMSEELGPLTYGRKDEMVFLGKEISHQKDYSEATQQTIDSEIRRLVDDAHHRALSTLRENADKLHTLAKALLEREILDTEEINKLMRGEELDPLVPEDVSGEGDLGDGQKTKERPEEGPGPVGPIPDPHPGPA
jgi:cell division protease FtsH